MTTKKIDKFKHLNANEVGLTIKLSTDGKLHSSIGFCFSEDLDPDRANMVVTMMHGVVSMIEECPQVLWSFGEYFRRTLEQEYLEDQEMVFEPDPELLKKMNGKDGMAKIIDISSRKKQ